MSRGRILRSACSSVLHSVVSHEATLILLLLVSLLAQFTSAVPNSPSETDDNEFAEFEFDDEEFEKSPPPVSSSTRDADKPRDTGGGPSFGGQDSGKRVDRHEDDEQDDVDTFDDEGQVEEEDGNEEDFEPDEEEFETGDSGGIPRTSRHGGDGSSGQGGQPDKLVITDIPAHLRNNWLNFQVEVLTLVGLAIYLGNYLMGKSKNQALATAWFEHHREQLENNFAVVGDDGREKEPSQGVLMKESDAAFSLWCTGRSGCQGMLVQIKLLKRQDLINTISRLVKPLYDQVQVKVTMGAEDLDTFVLAVGKKKTFQKYAKEMTDLSQFCQEKKTAENIGLPSSMTILSEVGEANTALLDPKVIATINKYEEAFDYFHFSDQFSGPKPQDTDQPKVPEIERVMIFNFNVPGKSACSERHIESLKPLLNLVFYMVDKAKRFHLSREFKVKAEKNRTRVAASYLKTTHAARQEAAQQRKEDKIRERKEKIIAEEDPERQRRLEKQEAKREAKRTQPRMKQLKVKAM